MTYLITICHTNSAVIWKGLENCKSTIGLEPDVKILVDHHYPIDYCQNKRTLLEQAIVYKYKLISPLRNLGAHKGFNWALRQIDLQPEDIVIGVDPDCNIVTPGWGEKMVSVLRECPWLGSISLLLDAIVPHNTECWTKQIIAGTEVGFLDKPEMFNVTAWKGDFLLKSNGLQALLAYYGHVEVAMRHEAQKHGFKQGYLMAYRETFNDVPHDEKYNKWKGLHVGGKTKLNFGDWLLAEIP